MEVDDGLARGAGSELAETVLLMRRHVSDPVERVGGRVGERLEQTLVRLP
jgi:hypothetical protein